MNRRMKEKDGFTYVEVIIALLLLSVCLAPLLIMFPTGSKEAQLAALYTRATNLAEDMMEEIKGKKFEDPDEPGSFGIESDEVEDPQTRAPFNDVDDYNGWSPNVPEDIDGDPMDGTGGLPDFSDFTRQVIVDYVKLDETDTWVRSGKNPEDDPTDYKRVTITINHPDMADVELVTIVALIID